ncbi:MAG: guanylate kinase [Acidobacteriota bacterium]|nr:guanylate kinase [Acidobacteriota bacterium]
MVFVVTGPSGSGKSTILRHVVKDMRRMAFSVSHTTRPRRPSERDGREYHFVSEAEFRRLAGRDAFVEWAVVHGHLYGTSRAEIRSKGRTGDVLLDIDVQGARQIRKRLPGATTVFILPPSFTALRRRLLDRGEDEAAVVRTRLGNAKAEIREAESFDYLIVNDRLDRAIIELEAVVLSVRCRAENRKRAIRAALSGRMA